MSNEFKAFMDARRLRARDVSDDLKINESNIYQWRKHGVPALHRERVERWMANYDKPSSEVNAELLEAVKRVHEITGRIVG